MQYLRGRMTEVKTKTFGVTHKRKEVGAERKAGEKLGQEFRVKGLESK